MLFRITAEAARSDAFLFRTSADLHRIGLHILNMAAHALSADSTTTLSRATLTGDASSPKRQKVTRACDNCKSRKRRCTGETPCPTCARHNIACTYDALYTRGRVPGHVSAGAERQEVSNALIPMHVPHLTSKNDRNGNAPTATLRGLRNGSPSEDTAIPENGHYWGPASPFAFLRRSYKRFGHDEGVHADTEIPHEDVSIFSYGDRQISVSDLSTANLVNRALSTVLVARYFEFATPTYRFLHQATVLGWLDRYHELEGSIAPLSPGRQAVVLVVLAIASLYSVDTIHTVCDATAFSQETWQAGEVFYQKAQVKLRAETGRVKLESVQARLAACLYLLSTSRLNEAWFTFGTTVQLAIAVGLHRSRKPSSPMVDCILQECQKRCFWVTFTLDTYLSVMLGRPAMIHDEDVDQVFPELVNDEDLTAEGILKHNDARDCMTAASVLHAKLMRIVKQACREQYGVRLSQDEEQMRTANRMNDEIEQWRQGLPVFLSGAIHPSSLIPMFRRQLTVLRLARAHAIMLVNRPLIFNQSLRPASVQPLIDKCLSGARDALETILSVVEEQHMFPAFWQTQVISSLCKHSVAILMRNSMSRSTASPLSMSGSCKGDTAEPRKPCPHTMSLRCSI